MLSNLITNRTKSDVSYVRALCEKGLNRMSNDEKSAFLSGLKGAYNATDLNRVESAVAFLPSFLNNLQNEINSYLASIGVAEDSLYNVPYNVPIENLETKMDWDVFDIPYVANLERYLSNITVARGWLELPADTPNAPDSMHKFTYEKANAIEQILLAVYETALKIKTNKMMYADRAKNAWKHCGTFYSGQEVFF